MRRRCRCTKTCEPGCPAICCRDWSARLPERRRNCPFWADHDLQRWTLPDKRVKNPDELPVAHSMSNQDSVVRLMLVDDKLEDAEHSISLLRNGGIAVRPSRPESTEELEAALAGSGSDLILAAYSARTI